VQVKKVVPGFLKYTIFQNPRRWWPPYTKRQAHISGTVRDAWNESIWYSDAFVTI